MGSGERSYSSLDWLLTVGRIWKLGNSAGLLYAQLILVCFGIADCLRSNQSYVSTFGALDLAKRHPDPRLTIGFLISSILVFPCALGLLRTFAGSRQLLSGIIGRRNSWILVANVFAACTLAVALNAVIWLETLSGNTGWNVSEGLAFNSWLEGGIYWVALYGSSIPALTATFILGLGVKYATENKKAPVWLADLPSRVLLADLAGPLYPSPGRDKLWFNASAIAPEIKLVKKRSDKLFAIYQDLMPGSLASAAHLETLAHNARRKLRTLFLGENLKTAAIEFYPSTSRALEVTLVRTPKDATIVLSPFEHPTEYAIAEWIRTTSNRKVESIRWNSRQLSKPWPDQMSAFQTRMLHHANEEMALLISEVSYRTGMRLPLKEIIKWLSTIRRRPTHIIIDGAHGIGNASSGLDWRLGPNDRYVFSGHKWLLSSDPVGVVVIPDSESEPRPSYDTWRDQLPASTVSARQICSLSAAVDVWDRFGVTELCRKAEEAKARFLSRMSPNLDVFGSRIGLPSSLIVAVRPADGYRWKVDTGELTKILSDGKSGVQLLPLEVDLPFKAIVRVSFPYFLEYRSVDRLVDRLRRLAVSV